MSYLKEFNIASCAVRSYEEPGIKPDYISHAGGHVLGAGSTNTITNTPTPGGVG